jgi:hypothetical protein
MKKSPGKPVPVNCGSSQPPSSRCVQTSQRMPRSIASEVPSAASNASSAQAVWDAVEAPRPRWVASL